VNNKNLIKEAKRMQVLAGLINESESNSQAHIYADKGLLLKVDDATKNLLESYPIPKEPKGEIMTKLPKDKLHVTLTSIANFKNIPYKEKFEMSDIKIPKIELGEAKFVYRGENREDRKYMPGGKTTYVVAIKNQDALKKYVDELYNSIGLSNPEPNRFFHITLANNAGGDSFQSIGNVDKIDFEL